MLVYILGKWIEEMAVDISVGMANIGKTDISVLARDNVQSFGKFSIIVRKH